MKLFLTYIILLIGINANGQGRVSPTVPLIPKPKPSEKKPKISNAKDVSIFTTDFSSEITIINYPPGKINHSSKKEFVNLTIEEIQRIRKKNKIIDIEITGFADGIENSGIPASEFNVASHCIKSKLIFDPELAELRACDIYDYLSRVLISYNIRIGVNIKMRFRDIPTNFKGNGEFRKAVIKIKFENE